MAHVRGCASCRRFSQSQPLSAFHPTVIKYEVNTQCTTSLQESLQELDNLHCETNIMSKINIIGEARLLSRLFNVPESHHLRTPRLLCNFARYKPYASSPPFPRCHAFLPPTLPPVFIDVTLDIDVTRPGAYAPHLWLPRPSFVPIREDFGSTQHLPHLLPSRTES